MQSIIIVPFLTEWRPILGFPSYFIRSDGQVLSYARGRPRYLTGWVTKDGYRQYNLKQSDLRRSKPYAHQLVMLAFVGPSTFPDAVVDHIDFDRLNNQVTNLRWYGRFPNTRRTPATAHFYP